MRKLSVLVGLAAALGAVSLAPAASVPVSYLYATITVNSNGSIGISSTPHVLYDGFEDVAFNVVNNSPQALLALQLTGIGIFHFDHDGINVYLNPTNQNVIFAPGAVHFGGINPGDYAGPTGNFFTGITLGVNTGPNKTNDTGIINFGNAGLAGNGGTSYFSLEAPVNADGTIGQLTVGAPPATPLPASLWGGAGLITGLAFVRRVTRKRV